MPCVGLHCGKPGEEGVGDEGQLPLEGHGGKRRDMEEEAGRGGGSSGGGIGRGLFFFWEEGEGLVLFVAASLCVFYIHPKKAREALGVPAPCMM